MANIDTTKIEGFDSMTAEQKVNALLGVSIPDEVDLSKYVLKSQFDKTASDLAESKRQLKGRMTEDEAAKAARDEKEAETQAQIDKLKEDLEKANRQLQISAYKNSYLNLGYDEKLAQETAEALANGDTEKVFANQIKHKADLEAKIKADLMKKDPRPSGGGGTNADKDPGVELATALAKESSNSVSGLQDTINKYAVNKS